MLVARTTFLAPSGVYMNIFDYYSDGKDENTGSIINSPILVPRPLVLC
jgi:hypothetical protein